MKYTVTFNQRPYNKSSAETRLIRAAIRKACSNMLDRNVGTVTLLVDPIAYFSKKFESIQPLLAGQYITVEGYNHSRFHFDKVKSIKIGSGI